MKIIDANKVDAESNKYAGIVHGTDKTWEPDRFQSKRDFKQGVEFAEKQIYPLFEKFILWQMFNRKYWIFSDFKHFTDGINLLAFSELFEIFLKSENDE